MKVKGFSLRNGMRGLLLGLGLGLPIFLNSCANTDSLQRGTAPEKRSRTLPVGDSSSPSSLSSPGDNTLAASPEYFRRPSPRPGYGPLGRELPRLTDVPLDVVQNLALLIHHRRQVKEDLLQL